MTSDQPSSSSSAKLSTSSLFPMREMDPLFKEFNEKREFFHQNVEHLVSQSKVVRNRLAFREQSYIKETLTRKEAEAKVKNMEEEINRLQKNLEERNGQVQASSTNAEKYLKELAELRCQLTSTQATADASAASAQSAQTQCLVLLKELDEKNNFLKDVEDHVRKLAEQLDNLEKDLPAREASQMQLKDEVVRVEHDIMQAVVRAGASMDYELRKLLDEVSLKNIEKINMLLNDKDDEIAKLKDEIRSHSALWKLKTKEMKSQLEKHRKAGQDLKKRVLKLEFCLQEARSQTRKLRRMGERRDKAIKELRDKLATKEAVFEGGKQNFWGSTNFKILVSMSMLVFVVFSKR